MADELYLQKSAQYSGGQYVGTDEKGNLYKSVVVFMIHGLKSLVPIVVKAVPEVMVNGQWLSEEIFNCISNLADTGFRVRGIVADNHSANVAAFNNILQMYSCDTDLCIQHPKNSTKTYMFFDNVHLLKNIRNNLLNSKKFVFPSFSFFMKDQLISASENGYVAWRDLHDVYDKDTKNKANLRKAPKLTFKALHPGNNKQNVGLASAVFHESTIAACKSYFPNRKDAISFLTLINCWWTVVNSKTRFHSNAMDNAVTADDRKLKFLNNFAMWLENWSQCSPSIFNFSKQTSNALIKTLRAKALLVEELLEEGFEYVIMSKLQSDPIERRFSQYRQLSGGNFLISLKEVKDSEKILLCQTLIKENINFFLMTFHFQQKI